ncbi:hypothetical protein [Devosia sp. CN2-171]|uniref:hypothetical protein n=1 Tax=Devosia sp. CN2-171 TaxID=3400909 RepID=UPI003BF8D75E
MKAATKIVDDFAGGRSDAYASRFATNATIVAPECNYVPSTPHQYLGLVHSGGNRDRLLPVVEFGATHQHVALVQHIAIVTQRLVMKTWSVAGLEPTYVTSTIVLHKVAGDWVAIHEHRS